MNYILNKQNFMNADGRTVKSIVETRMQEAGAGLVFNVR
jgi:hypothetical protein